MILPRHYSDLEKFLQHGKVLLLFGPRQVGKTTLLRHFISSTSYRYRFDTGDDIRVHEVLGSQRLDLISEYVQGLDMVIIDEAQRVPHIGLALKMMVDHHPELKIIATGSSSFELAGQTGEPLTGRKRSLTLMPMSQMELCSLYNPYDLKQRLEEFLVFGSYPEVCTSDTIGSKTLVLNEITNSYLLKDILELERVKGSKILLDLLRLLAFQVGNEVALNELSKKLGIDLKTVGRYIDLLEKSFIIFNLRGFSRNLRTEITKKSKYYFYDNGIRNALIANLNPMGLRNDQGQLWENFIIMERIKSQTYKQVLVNRFFWRTWEKKEIDLIEEREGRLYAYEFKFANKEMKAPGLWKENYPGSEFRVINPENYIDFVQ